MTKVEQSVGEVKNIFCAIDFHKGKMKAGVALDRGRTMMRDFNTDPDGGMSRLIGWRRSLVEAHPGSRGVAAYEASGCGFLLADVLEEAGISVAVLAPVNLPVTPLHQGRKTDAPAAGPQVDDRVVPWARARPSNPSLSVVRLGSGG